MRRTVFSACLAAAVVLVTVGSAAPASACSGSVPPSFGALGDCVDRTVEYVLDQLP